MSKQTIGEFLATLRKANGLTQLDVAEKLGISNRTLSSWECDKALPDILLLPALAHLYGVTVDEIIAGERRVNATSAIVGDAQNKLLQAKISRFTTPSLILTGLMILGVILFYVGLYVDLTTIAWSGWQWWLLLLFVGAIMAFACFVLLTAIFCGAKSFADEEQIVHSAYVALLTKKFALCCYSISATFALAFLVSLALPFFRSTDALVTMAIVFSLGAIVFALVGFLSYFVSLKKVDDQTAQAKVKHICKYSKKLSLWGLLSVGLAIVLTVLSICLINNPFGLTKTVFETETKDEFVKELECFNFDTMPYVEESFYHQLPRKGKYYLPLSLCASQSGDVVDLGNGFYAKYSSRKALCEIFVLVDLDRNNNSQLNEHVMLAIATVYRCYSQDGSWSVFIAKYCHEPYTSDENGEPTFRIDESDGKFSLVAPVIQTDVFGDYATTISWGAVALYYVIIFAICVVKLNKIKLKLSA